MYGGRIQLNIDDNARSTKMSEAKLIHTDQFVNNKHAFIPQKMQTSKRTKSIKTKLKLRKNKVEQDEMTKALKNGTMSHKDLA